MGAKRRVVIIDDEAAFAETLTRMVKSLGFEVTVSTDARSSYTFELKNSDIVFVDVLMPNVSGLQVLEKLAQQKAKSSIVLMSGHLERLDEAEKLARKLELNLVGALEKPVSPRRREGRASRRLRRSLRVISHNLDLELAVRRSPGTQKRELLDRLIELARELSDQ